MQTLVDRLRPYGWSDELSNASLRLAVIAAVALVAAWAMGPLLGRWLRLRAGGQVDVMQRVLRRLRWAVLLYGLYEGVRALPVLPALTAGVSGLLFVAVVLLALRAVAEITRLGLDHYLRRSAEGEARERAERDYLPLGSALATVALGLVALTLIAHHFGHDVSSLVAALGVGSLAIGLAAQQTLGNMIAGFLLLVDHPFGPGDLIRLASGESGTIEQIGIRSTRIGLGDGNLLVVPNAELANTRVVNLSREPGLAHGEVRCKVAWPVAAVAEQALRAALDAQPEIAREPAPLVRTVSIEVEAVELAAQFKVAPSARGKVEERLRAAVKAALVAARSRTAS